MLCPPDKMTPEYYILIIGYIFGFYMAWNIGANDVANSMASAVGAKAITVRQAIFIAGILNVVGAVFIGSHVTNTIRKGIVSTEIMNDPHVALIGALSALLAAASTVLLASKLGLPVSTTHAAVGGVLGVGLAGGIEAVNFAIVIQIMLYWILTVPTAAITSMVIFKILQLFF